MNVPQQQNTSSWAPNPSGSTSQPPILSSTTTTATTANFATSTPTRVEPLSNIIISSSSSLPLSSSPSLATTASSATIAGIITSTQQMGASSSSISGTPPSAGFKYPCVIIDDKKNRRTSLQVLPPKLPSSDSLSNSPGPASPGPTNWGDNHSTTAKFDGNSTEKINSPDSTKLNRKESYKAQRKNYRREKKRVASELLNSLQDPAVIVLADWLKIRGTLKSWTKLWCVLKPGLLLLYKSPKTKSSHWVGTILLTSCQVIERPSKKDGFCFKLFHPLEQSIWAPRGPDKETIGAVVQPLPTSYLIFRAPSQAAGKCWMDALELSLRCSALLLRSNSNSGTGINTNEQITSTGTSISHETQWSEADYEKHFDDHGEKLAPNKPTFLCKYIPPTPPPPMDRRITQLTSDQSASNSSINSLVPTPTATPVFHQLFLAVSHLEKAMSRSPELIKQKYLDIKNIANGGINDGGGGDVGDSVLIHNNNDRNCDNSRSRFKRNRAHCLNVKRSASRDDNFSGTTTPDFSPTTSPIKRAISFTALPCATDTDDGTPTLRRKSTPASLLHQKRIYKTRSIKKLKINDLDADSQNEGAAAIMSGLETESESDVADNQEQEDINEETPYVHLPEEEFGAAGEQVAELPEEQKSLIWFLVKQVRPGMDLSKVVLPTFILEPRSFLDKLSDSYYHADILSKAVVEDDPFTRMKTVVQWYMSGFYKKPKGLKKPYNPILGETFRCYWEHPNGSRTFYIAEQVSHHPPVSAFYVTNRQEGFCISCTILAKSKFYGNSTSAILDGAATLTLLPRGESYTLTVPYAHCKGILMGTLSMELGGKVSIECENTGYKADIEFKLKPFLGGSEYTNLVTGRLKLGKETLATIHGHWDGEIRIKDSRTGEETILFNATPEVKTKRLRRYVVPIESQANNESERLWQHVSAAIRRDDQVAATEEKTALEEAQRASAKERKATLSEWEPSHFQQDFVTGKWVYKYADLRPWDPRNDLKQFECNYRIQTKTRHQAPMVRTASIVSTEPLTILKTDSRSSLVALKQQQQQSKRKMNPKRVSQESTPEHGEQNSDSSQSNENIGGGGITIHSGGGGITAYAKNKKLMETLEKINRTLEDHSRRLTNINLNLERISFAPVYRNDNKTIFNKLHLKTFGYILFGIVLSVIVRYILKV